MDEAKRELVRNWLIKALHDLTTARKLASDPEPMLDTAIYHCQPSAEKAIKGFLVFHDQRFEKTHDLRLLINLGAMLESKLLLWLETGEELTPYATAYRYPGDVLEPERAELDHALRRAEAFFMFVLSLLPEEVSP